MCNFVFEKWWVYWNLLNLYTAETVCVNKPLTFPILYILSLPVPDSYDLYKLLGL